MLPGPPCPSQLLGRWQVSGFMSFSALVRSKVKSFNDQYFLYIKEIKRVYHLVYYSIAYSILYSIV